MKLAKELTVKAQDLRSKVAQYSADLDLETAMYPDQKRQISEWTQSHSDVLKEIAKLRTQVQKTNISTSVDIELGGKTVTKTIAEWIHRRRDLANMELAMWTGMTDKGLKEATYAPSAQGAPPLTVKIRRYYDPVERDQKMEIYRSEPGIIDRTLEVVNATTEVIT